MSMSPLATATPPPAPPPPALCPPPPRAPPPPAPPAAPAPTLAASPAVTPRPFITVPSVSAAACTLYVLPPNCTRLNVSAIRPWPPGDSAGAMSEMVPRKTAPAGMTSRPRESLTADADVAITASPFLFLRELSESLANSSMLVPSASIGGVGRGAGGWVLGCGCGCGRGWAGWVTGGRAAGWAAGWSLSCATDSAGARLRSRPCSGVSRADSPPPQAQNAAARPSVNETLAVLYITTSSRCKEAPAHRPPAGFIIAYLACSSKLVGHQGWRKRLTVSTE